MIERKFKPYSKAEILATIARLPDGATIDDAIDRLFFIRSLEVARAQVEAGDTFTQEEVEREMVEWQD